VVGDFKYAIQNFKGPRELPWQPNLGKNKPKLNKTSCLDRIVCHRNVINGLEDVFLWILLPICGLIIKEL